MDGEPAGRTVAVDSKGVGDARWHGDETAARNRDRVAFAPDLKGQLGFEHVERIGVVVVHVGPGHRLARGVSREGDREVVAGDEDADVARLGPKNRLSIGDRSGRAAAADALW